MLSSPGAGQTERTGGAFSRVVALASLFAAISFVGCSGRLNAAPDPTLANRESALSSQVSAAVASRSTTAQQEDSAPVPQADGAPPEGADGITPAEAGQNVPLPPDHVSVAVSPGVITLSWMATGEGLVASYDVERSPCCGGEWQRLAVVAADSGNAGLYLFADQNVTPGREYQYAVRAINSYNPNTESERAVSTPAVAQ